MTLRKFLILSAGSLALALAGCAGQADDPVAHAMGTEPTLDKPESTLLPTLKIAEAKGWAAGQMPTAAREYQRALTINPNNSAAQQGLTMAQSSR